MRQTPLETKVCCHTVPKTSEMSNLSSRIIDPSGPSQSVRLFHLEINKITIAQLENKISANKYTPPKKTLTEGFSKVETKAKRMRAAFQISFKVPIRYYEDGEAKTRYYMSTEKGTVLINLVTKYVEVRGSDRLARRFRRTFYSEFSDFSPVMEPLDLVENKSSKGFYTAIIKASEAKSKENTNIEHAVYTNVAAQGLKSADFRGEYLQHKKEVTVYGTIHKGTIAMFSGTLTFPSNTSLKTAINCQKGSIQIFRTEDGILEKDIRWLIDQMVAAANL